MADLVRVKKLFFTSKAVTDRLDPATRRALSKFGAFVRRRAKSALKYAKGASAPGRPPHVHRSAGYTVRKTVKGVKRPQPASPLRELLFFSYDPAAKSVVIGPALGGSRTGAPRTLEEGGQAKVAGKTVTVRPRPTMRPAFVAELHKIDGDWRNLITR